MGMHESFKDADDRDDTNDSSLGAAGDLTDGRATMVPPSGFSTLQVLYQSSKYSFCYVRYPDKFLKYHLLWGSQ